MKRFLLSITTLFFLMGVMSAQTTYLDFEGSVPKHYTFGGSDFEIYLNPDKTGINSSDYAAVTQKSGDGIETWGGAAFPLGGTVNFNFGSQVFTMDVYSSVIGTVTFKVEQGAQGPVEIKAQYNTPGAWQTLTFDMSSSATGLLNPDYAQIVIFMGFDSKAEDVWYYDNVKGPELIVGGTVDVTYNLNDLGGTVNSAAIEFSNDPGNKIALAGTPGVGSVWSKVFSGATGCTILAPVRYTVYVNDEAVPELTDLAFANAGSGTTTISDNFGTTPAGYNLLNDGGFDNQEGPLSGRTGNLWGTWSGNGGTGAIIDGVAAISPVQSGDNWNMQLEQLNFRMENDITYTAGFQAWADANRIICLTIEDPANGYALLGTTNDEGAYSVNGTLRSKWDILITTQPAYYQRTLYVDQVKENTSFKYAFLLAQTADKVYIDNVSLVEGEVILDASGKSAETFIVYPNPAKDNIYIRGVPGLTNASVYSLLGMKVKEITGVTKSLDVSDLERGMYFIRLSAIKGKTYTSKFLKD